MTAGRITPKNAIGHFWVSGSFHCYLTLLGSDDLGFRFFCTDFRVAVLVLATKKIFIYDLPPIFN